MASSRGVYGVEKREGVSVSVMGFVMESVMEDTIGKEMGEDWVCSEPIVGVSRVEQREDRSASWVADKHGGGWSWWWLWQVERR